MPGNVVITGIGLVTPLGTDPREVLRRVESGESAAAPPDGFDASPFACPVCAQVKGFRPHDYVAESKLVRLMNRDAQLAVAAARLALQDARLTVGTDYRPEDVALFGATGLAGLPLSEVTALIRNSVGPDGQFDASCFGRRGLKSISPLLSFKVLGNMPVCFVSICENIQGPNAIYTPWEGQGAQAIESGLRAIQSGDARCALVGGCDVKTHELAFIALEQLELFRSWKASRVERPCDRTMNRPAGAATFLSPQPSTWGDKNVAPPTASREETKVGMVPGEGAVFLVLEDEAAATARGARIYARVAGMGFGTLQRETERTRVLSELLQRLVRDDEPPVSSPGFSRSGFNVPLVPELALQPAPAQPPKGGTTNAGGPSPLSAIASACDGDTAADRDETIALSSLSIAAPTVLRPKRQAGNLFAAAAPLQVALGALLAERLGGRVLANCFGHGSEQAAFLLEKP